MWLLREHRYCPALAGEMGPVLSTTFWSLWLAAKLACQHAIMCVLQSTDHRHLRKYHKPCHSQPALFRSPTQPHAAWYLSTLWGIRTRRCSARASPHTPARALAQRLAQHSTHLRPLHMRTRTLSRTRMHSHQQARMSPHRACTRACAHEHAHTQART